MKRTSEDICQNETDPDLYLKRAREIRRRKIEEICGVVAIIAILAVAFTIVQVAYGIW